MYLLNTNSVLYLKKKLRLNEIEKWIQNKILIGTYIHMYVHINIGSYLQT